MMIQTLSLFLILTIPLSEIPDTEGTLMLQIRQVQETRGELVVGLFSSPDRFPLHGKECWSTVLRQFEPGVVEVRIPDLPYGAYALAVFHDVNGNGKLDKNMMGVPQEPYAFSNDPPARWKRPSFDESRFRHDVNSGKISVELRSWNEHE